MQNSKRLFEMLEEEQEPFLLDVYLVENGHSDTKLNSININPTISSCIKLTRLTSSGFKRIRSGGILRFLLSKFPFIKAIRNSYTNANNAKFIAQCFESSKSLEEKTKKLSPISVLQLASDDDSTYCNLFEEESMSSTCCLNSPRESSLSSTSPTPHHVLLDYIKELQGKLSWGSNYKGKCHIINDFSTYGSCDDENFLLAWQLHGLANISQLANFDFTKAYRSWSNFQIEIKEIGRVIESIIFEEIKEEIILDLLY